MGKAETEYRDVLALSLRIMKNKYNGETSSWWSHVVLFHYKRWKKIEIAKYSHTMSVRQIIKNMRRQKKEYGYIFKTEEQRLFMHLFY